VTDPHLERRLEEAFDAAARSAVPEAAGPPPPRFTTEPASPVSAAKGHGRVRWAAPLAAAAAVVAVGGTVLALQGSGSGGGDQHRTAAPGAAAAVQIKMATVGDQSYGVGLPVVAYFSRQFASARSLSTATSVTVNGVPAHGAWYFVRSTKPGFPVEGHFRLKHYWPANSTVQVDVAARQVPAGGGATFSNDVRVSFRTGPKVIATVEDQKHRMIVIRDGKPDGVYPVALGAATTPTTRGIKVIMKKSPSTCMHDVAGTYHECGIKWAQELTYSGEYLHAAPWNVEGIKRGQDNSNGCTNLLPGNAQALYKVLAVGDVVNYPDATGPAMQMTAGFGDWNVPWATWQRGGLIPTY
jgi:lipoprotein-anchoring transpeptidase ErfK/SrfK